MTIPYEVDPSLHTVPHEPTLGDGFSRPDMDPPPPEPLPPPQPVLSEKSAF
jgi:hypothetical protein